MRDENLLLANGSIYTCNASKKNIHGKFCTFPPESKYLET